MLSPYLGSAWDWEVGHFSVCVHYKAILFLPAGIPEKDLGRLYCPGDEKQGVVSHGAVHNHCAIHPLTGLESYSCTLKLFRKTTLYFLETIAPITGSLPFCPPTFSCPIKKP